MPTYVDHNYYQELADTSPDQICRNNRCRFDPISQIYSLVIWGEEFIVDYSGKKVERTGTALPVPHEYFYLFVMYYLLLPKEIKPGGEWISEKDLPGGTTFFRGPHLIPTEMISSRFGDDIEAFSNCCVMLGGTPLKLADAAFRFDITPDIPVAVLYWQGDDDFPAEAKILYDRSIMNELPLDILFALAVAICNRIAKAGLIS